MKKICLVFLWIGVVSISLLAKEIGGVDVKEAINLNNTSLTLQGAGVRSKFIFDIYVGALYLQNKMQNPQKIIEGRSPMDIRMIITSSLVTGSKMKEGFGNDFKVMESIGYKVDKNPLQRFFDTFSSTIHKNDIFDFLFIPKKGLFIYKNGKKVTKIDNFEFKRALYAIWFSKRPAQESLKNKMLGR